MLEEDLGFYSLLLQGNFSFRVPLERLSVDLSSLQMQKLKASFRGEEMFTTQDVCRRLSVATTTAHRLIREALRSGLLVRIGNPQRPKGYQLASPALRAAG